MNVRNLLTSLGMIVFAGAVVVGATGAFFSDTETSTGNVFAAGDIDLQIDNESYFTNEDGRLVVSASTSWSLTDLTIEKFFNFFDVKPGDFGEDTISIHVGSNDAWLCAAARVTGDNDVTYTEPELDDDTATSTPPGTGLGELDEQISFAFWIDDGDNVFEEGQGVGGTSTDGAIFLKGPISALGQSGQIPIADTSGKGPLGSNPVSGDSTFYIGKAWCFGALTVEPVDQDGQGKTGTNGPLQRGTGFGCDGTNVDNAAQTDEVIGDLEFYAEQSRNNGQFLCSNWSPSWDKPPL